jgi:ABC-type Fe3+/spermidine/putrescine transport system ATPase subunit
LIAVDSVPFEILTGSVRDFAIGVRPEKIRVLDPHMTVPGSVTIEATVEQRLYRGDVTELRVRTARHVWRVAMLNASRRTGFMPEPGERVRIAFAPEDAMVLPE